MTDAWRTAAFRPLGYARGKLGISLDVYRAHRERGERWCGLCRCFATEEHFNGRRNSCGRSRLEQLALSEPQRVEWVRL